MNPILILLIVTSFLCSTLEFNKCLKENGLPLYGRKVEISLQGRNITGTINETATSCTKYYQFQGVPYAKPPVGNLRFEPPQPYQWEGTYDATYERNICVQKEHNSTYLRGSEDCLYLNIFTPVKSFSSPSSVLLWIHGGGFIYGNGNYESNPIDRFIDDDLVVITLNYRLGVFGFFATGDSVVPGNMGLKDQILALKWVKDNIIFFGGDSRNVTIMGQSVGGACVTYLIQSPAAKGLFTRGIAHSGVSLSPWALGSNSVDATLLLAKQLSMFCSNTTEIVERLKKIDTNKLYVASIASMNTILSNDSLNGFVYGPVIEPPNPTEIFSFKSYEQLNSCNMTSTPLILGYNSEEGKDTASNSILIFNLTRYNLSPSDLVPIDMNLNTAEEKNQLGSEIKKIYAGLSGLNITIDQFYKYVSHHEFVRSVIKYSALYSKCGQPVYQYRFSYTQNANGDAHHSEEMPYFFNNGSLEGEQNNKFSVKVVKLWSNFAKTGNPTPDNTLNTIWYPSVQANKHSYLDIGNEFVNHDQETNPDGYYLNKWTQWYDTYGNRPYTTY